MLPQHESGIRASLAARGAQDIRVDGKSVRQFVKEILGDEMKSLKKVRLTWHPSEVEDPADPSLRVGQLRKWKPYIGPIGRGRYYIQNAMVLFANGLPVEDMSVISDKKIVERIVDGKGNFLREQEFKSDKEWVEEAMTSYLSMALRLDPNLCRYCVRFSAPDRDAYMRHVRREHRNEFDKMMQDADDADAAPPEPELEGKKKRVS